MEASPSETPDLWIPSSGSSTCLLARPLGALSQRSEPIGLEISRTTLRSSFWTSRADPGAARGARAEKRTELIAEPIPPSDGRRSVLERRGNQGWEGSSLVQYMPAAGRSAISFARSPLCQHRESP